MSKQREDIPKLITLRVPPDLIKQIDSLVPILRSDSRFNLSGQVTRSDVLRHAITLGVTTLTREINTKKKKSSKK